MTTTMDETTTSAAPRQGLAGMIGEVESGLAKPLEINVDGVLVGEVREQLAFRQSAVRHHPLAELHVAPDVGVPQRHEVQQKEEKA